jgi:hypothetical protein
MNVCRDIPLDVPFTQRAYDVDSGKWHDATYNRIRVNVRTDDPAKGLATKVRLGPYWVYVVPVGVKE